MKRTPNKAPTENSNSAHKSSFQLLRDITEGFQEGNTDGLISQVQETQFEQAEIHKTPVQYYNKKEQLEEEDETKEEEEEDIVQDESEENEEEKILNRRKRKREER